MPKSWSQDRGLSLPSDRWDAFQHSHSLRRSGMSQGSAMTASWDAFHCQASPPVKCIIFAWLYMHNQIFWKGAMFDQTQTEPLGPGKWICCLARLSRGQNQVNFYPFVGDRAEQDQSSFWSKHGKNMTDRLQPAFCGECSYSVTTSSLLDPPQNSPLLDLSRKKQHHPVQHWPTFK